MRMDIERALRWAFQDELSKAVPAAAASGDLASSWGAVASYAQLLAKIDLNRYGLVPNLAEAGLPHPDAVAIGEAVMALDEGRLAAPDDWNPCADIALCENGAPLLRAAVALAVQAETVVDRDGERALRTKPSRIVMRWALAKSGSRPDWEIETPAVRPVITANGMPKWFRKVEVWEGDEGGNPELGAWRAMEVDGYDRKRKRPYPDAYRKFVLDPDPALGIAGRIEYEIWRDCLDALSEVLDGKLETIVIEPSARPQRPWEGGREPRILFPTIS